MTEALKIVVHLYAHEGAEALLRSYEATAADIMSRYGGHIEQVIVPDQAVDKESSPSEIHIVTFPNQGAFALYRDDPDLLRIAPLREQAIARTEVFVGRDGLPYPTP